MVLRMVSGFESSPSLQDTIGFIRNWMHTSNENRIKQVPVLFSHGDGCMEYLQRGGFSEEEATCVEVFYQLRRAHTHRAIQGIFGGETPCMMSFKARLWSRISLPMTFVITRPACERMEDFSLLLVGETAEKGMQPKPKAFVCYIPCEPKTPKVCHDSSRHVCRCISAATVCPWWSPAFWPSQRCLYRRLEGS